MTQSTYPSIPGYRIAKVLGEGGMATVYLAIQELLEREVALKVMKASWSKDAVFGQRFLREARIASQLAHPNIITVYEVGVHNDIYYLSMEYIAGPDLSRAQDTLSIRQKLTVINDVAHALNFAAKKGYVHRDIKPENILLREQSLQAVLMDFGIARSAQVDLNMTQVGTSLGTPHYMSPEQIRGDPVDYRSDLYSLGVVLYFLLLGRVPYTADNAVTVGIMHINEPVPELPKAFAALQRLIDRLMAKQPEQRFSSAQELIDELAAVDMDALEKKVALYESVSVGESSRHAHNPNRDQTATVIGESLHVEQSVHADARPPTSTSYNRRSIVSLMLLLGLTPLLVWSVLRHIPATEAEFAGSTPDAVTAVSSSSSSARPSMSLSELRKQAEESYQEGSWGRAYRYAQSILQLEPNDHRAQELSKIIEDYQLEENQVNEWLAHAEILRNAGHYFVPSEQNAYALYAKVLRLRPNNDKAQQGMQATRDAFKDLLDDMLRNGDQDFVEHEIHAARRTAPDDAALQRLAEHYLRPAKSLQSESGDLEAGARIVKALISDQPIQNVLDDAPRFLHSGRTLYGALRYEGFAVDAHEIVYAVLEDRRGADLERVPIVLSAPFGETHFRIDRAAQSFADGHYRLRFLMGEQQLAQVEFEIAD